MRILPLLVASGALGALLPAQAVCSSAAQPTTIWTMNPFAGTSLYGHPNYPNSPGPTFPGFTFLIDTQSLVPVELSRIDLDLYDDGNLVSINSTTTVTSPNQVGATAPVTFYLFPGPTWAGMELTQAAWLTLGVGTLTVQAHHTDSPIVFNPPITIPAGDFAIAFQVPQTTNGPNPGPLHPMLDNTPTTPQTLVHPAITFSNINFQRESWTATLTPATHMQSLEFHIQPIGGYANWTSFGTGCGQPTPPQLRLAQNPVVGTTVDFETINIAAAAPFCLFAFGFQPDQAGLSLAPYGLPGCYAHLSLLHPTAATTLLVTGGVATFQWALPNDPAISGIVLYAQSAPVLGGTPAFHVSNAVCFAIGLYY